MLLGWPEAASLMDLAMGSMAVAFEWELTMTAELMFLLRYEILGNTWHYFLVHHKLDSDPYKVWRSEFGFWSNLEHDSDFDSDCDYNAVIGVKAGNECW